MAEAVSEAAEPVKEQEKNEKANETLECAVCLQTCVHPAELPCGHIFCFLCVKGIANQSKRCAMCRQEIPRDFIEHPKLLQPPENTESYDDGYQWFYEGRNGWWQYDERTSKELEASYKEGERTCELLIAGFLYVIDLESMIQMRRNDPLRRRRIKRDLASVPKKGVAGLRTDTEVTDCTTHPEIHRPHSPTEGRTDNLIPITPTNTPQTPVSGQESPHTEDLQATMERIRLLRLDSNDNNRQNAIFVESNDYNEDDLRPYFPNDRNGQNGLNRFQF